jgi:hypothetical protein
VEWWNGGMVEWWSDGVVGWRETSGGKNGVRNGVIK